MKIERKFAPYTITIETPQDAEDFKMFLDAAEGSLRYDRGRAENQWAVLEKLMLFKRDLGLK